jgi:hypothetical protein
VLVWPAEALVEQLTRARTQCLRERMLLRTVLCKLSIAFVAGMISRLVETHLTRVLAIPSHYLRRAHSAKPPPPIPRLPKDPVGRHGT